MINVGKTKINHPPNHHNRRYKPFTHGWFMTLFYHVLSTLYSFWWNFQKRYPSRPFPFPPNLRWICFFQLRNLTLVALAFFCHVMWIVSDRRTEDKMRQARMSVFGECCPKSGELLLSTVLVIHFCKSDMCIYIYIYIFMHIYICVCIYLFIYMCTHVQTPI